VLSDGAACHAEGYGATASGFASHAEGGSTASGWNAHSEGCSNATGRCSHAEGESTSRGQDSHAEGSYSEAIGEASHARGIWTTASKKSQTTLGSYNVIDSATTTIHPSGERDYGKYAVIVGNGTGTNARSNALAVRWDGSTDLYS